MTAVPELGPAAAVAAPLPTPGRVVLFHLGTAAVGVPALVTGTTENTGLPAEQTGKVFIPSVSTPAHVHLLVMIPGQAPWPVLDVAPGAGEGQWSWPVVPGRHVPPVVPVGAEAASSPA